MVKPNTENTATKAGTSHTRRRRNRRITQAHRAATAPLSRIISKAPPRSRTKKISCGAEPVARASKSRRGSCQGTTGDGAVWAKLPGTTTVCPAASWNSRW